MKNGTRIKLIIADFFMLNSSSKTCHIE